MEIEDAINQSNWVCDHIGIHTFEDGSTQCKDCLRKWPPAPPVAAMADRELIERLRRWMMLPLYDSSGELRSVSDDCEDAVIRLSALSSEVERLKEVNRQATDSVSDLQSECHRLTSGIKALLDFPNSRAALSGDAEHSIKSAGKR